MSKNSVNRVCISTSRLNSQGFRVLTSGMDVEQFRRNPVLLYMHERGQVVGLVRNLMVGDDCVVGELVFDEATELSRRLKAQWEFGSVNMVSIGAAVLETSKDKGLIEEGQTRETVTRCKLMEVSVVDIGANDDAVRLMREEDGQVELCNEGGGALLPVLLGNNNIINKTERKFMDQEKLALQLGLEKDADEAMISAELAKLMSGSAEAQALREERDALLKARIEGMVDAAVAAQKIGAEKKQQFVDLGAKIGADELEKVLDAMNARVKLSDLVGQGGQGSAGEWKKLSDVPSGEVAGLKEKRPEVYAKLYEAEYGIKIED